MTEPVNVERSKRLSITSLPLHAIPEHEQYRRRTSQDDHNPTPDNTSPDSSPRSSPFEKERRGEIGSSMEDDAAVKKRKKKLFHNLFRRSSETVVIPEEKEDERLEAAPERGLTFTYSSPLPAPGLAASSEGMLSSSPNRRPPLAASAPAGAFCLSPVNSPSLSSSPAPSHPHYAHQSNSMGKKTGLDKLKAMMKDKPNGSPDPQEFTSSVFALVSPRDSRKDKDTKEKDSDTKEKHEHKDKEKHKDKSKKKDKEKDKDKDRDDGSATPEKKKGFLTFSRRRSVSTGASTIQPPPREHVSSPSLLSSITSSAAAPTITSLRELDPEVPLEFDLPPQCKESLEALMKDPPGVRLFYAFCVKENYDNMLQFWNQARYFQRGGTYAGDAVNELRSGAIASDALNDMLGAPMPSGDVKLEAEALFYTYIANGSPSEMSIQPIIRAQLDKHIHEGTIHRDMFDRLTRSVYDEISREPYTRFIKLFDPEKLQQEFIQRKHSASNPPPPILPPASPTLTSLRSLVRRASTPSAPLLSPTFLQNPAYAQGAGSSAFHPLAATNAHYAGSASSSQPGSAHVSPHNSMHSLPTLQIPPQMHTPPHHLHTPPHTPPYHGGYQPPPSPTHAHYHNLYSHSPSPSHHLFNSNFAPSSSSPHPLSHSLHAQHTMSMSSQYSGGFPSSPPHHPLSHSSHYPSSSPANHHPLAYYTHHPPSPITVPQSPGRHSSPSPPFPQPPSSPSTARHPLSHSATSQPPLSKSASPRLPSPRELHALSRKLSISIPPLDVAPPPAPAEKYGVAFKIKRGACQPPCDCEYYQPPGDNGGPCQNCGHFPATHVNLGKVDALSTSPQEKMAHTPPLSLSIASTGSASTSSSNLMASVNTSPSNSSSNLLSPTIHNHPLASSGGRKDSLGGKGDLNPLGGFVPISPTQDGETEDIFSGMSNWKLDADEITFSDKIGEGSAAKVYKGVWRNQEVAIKILKNAPDSSELSEFKKELEIMSSLRSPYIIYFFGMVLRPKVCMLMEYCGRKSLYHVMNTKGELGWDRVFAFVAGAVRGINALHNWSPPILHRDLKSLNLLITDNWAIRIADFGLSRFHTGDLATLSKVRGTYAYCAPEVYFGQQYTTKSDIYSMGIVIWELVTRCLRGKYERPFAEHKHIQYDFQIIIQAAKENLRPTIPPTCPEGLANIIRLCLDPNPEIRPSGIHLLEMVLDCEKAYTDSKKKWDKVREKPKS